MKIVMGHFFLKAVSKSGCEKVYDSFIFHVKLKTNPGHRIHNSVNILVYKLMEMYIYQKSMMNMKK